MLNTKKICISDLFLYIGIIVASIITCVVLIGLICFVLAQGAAYINWSYFFLHFNEGGIYPAVVSTIYVVFLGLLFSTPLSLISAIYLNEYAGKSIFAKRLRLAINTLQSIPSIIYGMFGLVVIVRGLGLGASILSGGITISIMILPVSIRAIEESLKVIPNGYRHASLALGATKWQTIWRVVLPQSLAGITNAMILSAGRIVAESAPLLLTVGVGANVPKNIFEQGRVLSVHMYYLTKEALSPEDFTLAFASASAIILLVLCIIGITRLLSYVIYRTTH